MGFWKSLGYGVVEEEEYSFNRLLDRTITSSFFFFLLLLLLLLFLETKIETEILFVDQVRWLGVKLDLGEDAIGFFDDVLVHCVFDDVLVLRWPGCQCRWCELGSEWEHGPNGCSKFESPGRKPTTNLISTALPLSILIQTSSSHWLKP